MRIVCGTRSQILPVIIAAARSDDPTPIAKQFSAPQVTVWLSAPTIKLAGATSPRSTTIW